MALDITALSAVGYGAGQRLWLYNTTDTSVTINAANYFTTAPDKVPTMAVNDIVLVTNGTSTYQLSIAAITTSSSTTIHSHSIT
jgi:hypothetical protein